MSADYVLLYLLNQLPDNFFAATAAGRAKFQTGFFDAATVLDKFAANSIPASRLQVGALPAPVGARSSTTSTVAGTVIAELLATAGSHLVGIGWTGTAGGAGTRFRVVLTFTDDSTETLEGAATGASPVYIGNRAGFFNNAAPEIIQAAAANLGLKVKKVSVQIGGAAAAGTKLAVITAHEVVI